MYPFNNTNRSLEATLRDISGCYYTTGDHPYRLQRHYLPQVELTSNTTIFPLFFTTNLTQTFTNSTSNPIKEARYTFPLYDGVAVTAFTCTIGGRVIKGHVEQKDQARQTFNAAVEQGQSAGLLESLPLGIFAATLGNIPAKEKVVVNITYGGELKHDAEIDGLRYTLPTAICPRYGAYPGELLKADTAVANTGIHITVDVDMEGSAIRKVQSPSKDHPISVSLGNLSTESGQATPKTSKASITLTLQKAELSTDFVLQILVDNIGSPQAVLEEHPTLPGHQALITTFVPRFGLKGTKPEIVFVADQSGSMMGEKNRSLVAALVTFLKSLPVGVRFNICAFGSSHIFLWEKSQPYTLENAAEALAYVQRLNARMGGTEMYPAIMDTFDKRLADIPLDIILLTDGAISRETELFSYINKKIEDEKVDARIFTLGIGDDVSTTLVEGVARAGRGFGQFVVTNEVMDQKVIRMLKAALYPHINGFSLEPQYTDDGDEFEMVEDDAKTIDTNSTGSTETKTNTAKPAVISMFDGDVDIDIPIDTGTEDRYSHLPDLPIPNTLQVPGQNSPLFLFNRTTAYLLMKGSSNKAPTSVILRAQSPQGPLELSIPVHTVGKGTTVHHLAVRKLTHELEEGRGWVMDAVVDGKPVRSNSRADEFLEREAVRLGLTYQVANKWCSFIAVDDSGTVASKQAYSTDEVSSIALPRRGFPGGMSAPLPPPPPAPAGGGLFGGPAPSTLSKLGSLFGAGPPASRARKAFGASPAYGADLLDIQSVDACAAPSVVSTSKPSPPSIQSRQARVVGEESRRAPKAEKKAKQSAFMPMACMAPSAPPGGSLFGGMAAGGGSSGASPFDHADGSSFAPAPPRTLQQVRDLISQQGFAGCWEWNAAILKSLEIEASAVEQKGGKADDVTMTVLVLQFLRTKAMEFEGVWEMVAEKADLWLEDNATEEEREKLRNLVREVL